MFARNLRDSRFAVLDSSWLEGTLALGRKRLYYKPVNCCADKELASDGWHCAGRHANLSRNDRYAFKGEDRGARARNGRSSDSIQRQIMKQLQKVPGQAAVHRRIKDRVTTQTKSQI
jgi:hypothetical protein